MSECTNDQVRQNLQLVSGMVSLACGFQSELVLVQKLVAEPEPEPDQVLVDLVVLDCMESMKAGQDHH
jgi:hypothetical protein